MRTLFKAFSLMIALSISSVWAQAEDAPLLVVEAATNGVINELKKTPAEERDAQMVERLVEEYILPAIDQKKNRHGRLGQILAPCQPG